VKYYRVETPTGPAWAREDGACLRLLSGAPWTEHETRRETLAPEEARLVAPVAPSKIVAVGLNYRDHAKERGKPLPAEPLLFLKPPSAVIGPGAAIRRPAWAGRVDHEASSASSSAEGARAGLARGGGRAQSSAPSASTTSPPASCRTRTCSSRAARASTPSARSGPASPPTSTSERCA
jgi:hypothetical protein